MNFSGLYVTESLGNKKCKRLVVANLSFFTYRNCIKTSVEITELHIVIANFLNWPYISSARFVRLYCCKSRNEANDIFVGLVEVLKFL